MKLSTAHFKLELRPSRKVDAEDWVRVHVLLTVSGFQGDLEAWLQLEDLVRFRDEIEEMHTHVGENRSATLASAEPDIDVSLNSNQLGGIEGTYRFESERLNGYPTSLSGAFELDQSFLPSLLASVDSLISRLRVGSTG